MLSPLSGALSSEGTSIHGLESSLVSALHEEGGASISMLLFRAFWDSELSFLVRVSHLPELDFAAGRRTSTCGASLSIAKFAAS